MMLAFAAVLLDLVLTIIIVLLLWAANPVEILSWGNDDLNTNNGFIKSNNLATATGASGVTLAGLDFTTGALINLQTFDTSQNGGESETQRMISYMNGMLLNYIEVSCK